MSDQTARWKEQFSKVATDTFDEVQSVLGPGMAADVFLAVAAMYYKVLAERRGMDLKVALESLKKTATDFFEATHGVEH